mmetsp:Transcript_11887/g.23053  ORF Transcript_11887/g.23053 Transcript_11887/m.23053 type:complete len:313 (-) Transcript_11887:82-1020(-)
MSLATFCLLPLAAVGPPRAMTRSPLLGQHRNVARAAADAPWMLQQPGRQSWVLRRQSSRLWAVNAVLAALAALTASTTRQRGRSTNLLRTNLLRSVPRQRQPRISCLAAAQRTASNEGQPEWEFEEANARVFSQLASTMRVVAKVFLVKAVVVHGFMCFGTYLLHSNPGLVFPDIFGEMAEMFDYIFFSYFLNKAASDIQAIADSTGSDITFLMRGVAALLAFFQRLIIVGAILILKGASTTKGHLNDLLSLKQQGIAVQVAAAPPFGFVPPAWCFPVGFFAITVFMVVLGRKSLWDDYGQISRDMQPSDKK